MPIPFAKNPKKPKRLKESALSPIHLARCLRAHWLSSEGNVWDVHAFLPTNGSATLSLDFEHIAGVYPGPVQLASSFGDEDGFLMAVPDDQLDAVFDALERNRSGSLRRTMTRLWPGLLLLVEFVDDLGWQLVPNDDPRLRQCPTREQVRRLAKEYERQFLE